MNCCEFAEKVLLVIGQSVPDLHKTGLLPKCMFVLIVFLKIVQARYFFQQLISGVSYCHSMVLRSTSLIGLFSDLYVVC